MMQNKENLAPPPGIWRTIAAGFDLTTRHLWLLILPICLDVFLWLGPRLSAQPIIEQAIALLPVDPMLQDFTQELLTLAPRTNAFTSLSAPLVGLPALMVGLTPEKTPLPTPVTELNNPLIWLGLFCLFTIIGLCLAAFYYVLIAQALRLEDEQTPLPAGQLINRSVHTWLNLLALGLIFVIIGIILYIPLFVLGFLASLISPFLATMVLFAGPVLLIWFFIFVYFVPHGLALNGMPLYKAILLSGQLVRTFFGQVLLLLMAILVVRNVLASLLMAADDGSWLTGVSLLGHAFIMTAMIAAAFIFFRDRYELMSKRWQMVNRLES